MLRQEWTSLKKLNSAAHGAYSKSSPNDMGLQNCLENTTGMYLLDIPRKGRLLLKGLVASRVDYALHAGG